MRRKQRNAWHAGNKQYTHLLFRATNNIPLATGDNFAVSLSIKSEGEVTKTFGAISAGGKITMPLQDTFWEQSLERAAISLA